MPPGFGFSVPNAPGAIPPVCATPPPVTSLKGEQRIKDFERGRVLEFVEADRALFGIDRLVELFEQGLDLTVHFRTCANNEQIPFVVHRRFDGAGFALFFRIIRPFNEAADQIVES